MPRSIKDNRQELYETTELSLSDIAIRVGSTHGAINTWVNVNYSAEYRRERKRIVYSRSKMGDKNPMYGKTGDLHHNKKERTSDCKGYWLVLKPNWYTGRKGSKHIYEHHYVYCKENNMTEIPKGMCIHHIDGDKLNNDINNLLYLSTSDHMKLHALQNISNKES